MRRRVRQRLLSHRNLCQSNSGAASGFYQQFTAIYESSAEGRLLLSVIFMELLLAVAINRLAGTAFCTTGMRPSQTIREGPTSLARPTLWISSD